MTDESHYSTRYYRAMCPDIIHTITTDGPDDRNDPRAEFMVACLIKEHGDHPLVRISPGEYAELHEDDDEGLYADADYIDKLIGKE